MIDLPVTPHVGNQELINTMLIVSRPKVGKTQALMQLPNSILIDLENSSDYYDGVSVNVEKVAMENKKGHITVLRALASKIELANKERGDYMYQFGIIDTVTKLEEYAERYATWKYRNSPQGANYTGRSVVTDLEYGAGYKMLRDSMNEILGLYWNLFETLILVGHVKDSSINVQGKSISATDLDLTGKVKQIVSSKCDVIGTMYRHVDGDPTNYLSFITQSTDLITGARPKHLSGKEFKISELDPDTDVLTTYWDQIFKNIAVTTA